ncbi:ABC transporter substrate-binding protein [Sulfurospirillum sp. 1612]|uniref:ABC transporter substrate-binding protein n=1 Tax=Sulfurospirillum sp. 1612 TaxID=3094835 RepID=UPI002F927DC0
MVKKSYILVALIFVTILIGTLFSYTHDPLKDQNEIRLGASLPLSGINQNLGKEIVIGADTYFQSVNATGGVHHKKIKFIYYDDKYEPEITWSNTKRLIDHDSVFALFEFVGTPTTKKILPLVEKRGIPFIAPYTGASFLRNPKFKNIINFRSSYQEEVDALIGYLTKNKKFSKFSIFYQNDDYGREGYIALLKALKKRGLALVSEGTYKRNTLFVKQALYDIKDKKPEAVILIGSYKPTARFIKKARKDKSFKSVIFCPISFVNANALMEELHNNGHNLLFSQTVPTYTNNTAQAQEYLKLLQTFHPHHPPTFASFESFLAAKVLVKSIEKIKGNITTKKFLENIKTPQEHTLEDVNVHYKHSQLLNSVYLLKFQDGIFKTICEKK